MAYSYSWDETSPAGSSNISLGDDRIREMKQTIREALDDEHTSLVSAPTGPLMHAWAIKALSTGSPYTALSSDHVLLVTTGASDYTINLPTAVGIKGKPYKIKKVDSGAGTVIIDGYGTETIDGALTFTLAHQNDFVDIVSDNANWEIVSTNTNLKWDNVWSDAVHDHSSNAEGGVLSYTQLKFLATPTNKVSWTAITDWTDVDISADTGTDTAKAALVQVTLNFSQSSYGGQVILTGYLRKNGSSATSNLPRLPATLYASSLGMQPYVKNGGMFIVECDGSEIFETKLEQTQGTWYTGISYTVDLIGYFV